MTLQHRYTEPPADIEGLEAARAETLAYIERLRLLNLQHDGLGDIRKDADGLLAWIDGQLLDLRIDEPADAADAYGDFRRDMDGDR